MAFAPPNPMITRCKKCGWSYKQSSDVIESFGSCPKCGSEALEISFAKGNPFGDHSGQPSTDSLLNKIKNLFKS